MKQSDLKVKSDSYFLYFQIWFACFVKIPVFCRYMFQEIIVKHLYDWARSGKLVSKIDPDIPNKIFFFYTSDMRNYQENFTRSALEVI